MGIRDKITSMTLDAATPMVFFCLSSLCMTFMPTIAVKTIKVKNAIITARTYDAKVEIVQNTSIQWSPVPSSASSMFCSIGS